MFPLISFLYFSFLKLITDGSMLLYQYWPLGWVKSVLPFKIMLKKREKQHFF